MGFAGWQQKARAWCLKQRITELEKSINYWPNSERRAQREAELSEKKEELREFEVGYH